MTDAVLRATYVKRARIDRYEYVRQLSVTWWRKFTLASPGDVSTALELGYIRSFHQTHGWTARQTGRQTARGTHDRHTKSLSYDRIFPITSHRCWKQPTFTIGQTYCNVRLRTMQIWASCFQERRRYPRSMGIFDKEFFDADVASHDFHARVSYLEFSPSLLQIYGKQEIKVFRTTYKFVCVLFYSIFVIVRSLGIFLDRLISISAARKSAWR